MDIVMAGVRRNIPVKVTPQMLDAVAAYRAAPREDHGGRSPGQVAAYTEAMRSVDCPRQHCRVQPGEKCVNPQGHPMREKIHAVRVNRADVVFRALMSEAELTPEQTERIRTAPTTK
ncbi:MAG: hypothetical protein PVJ28_00140 [Acidimicrobiia bacterium]|jgi:hypothetical protein